MASEPAGRCGSAPVGMLVKPDRPAGRAIAGLPGAEAVSRRAPEAVLGEVADDGSDGSADGNDGGRQRCSTAQRGTGGVPLAQTTNACPQGVS